jgi:hypothetical protein
VQAPAQEALKMVGPSRRPRTGEPDAPHREPAAPTATHRPPALAAAPRSRPHPDHPDRPDHPAHARRQKAGIPGISQPVPKAPDVCALGKKYGGWRKDSPEAVICEQTYGH